MSLLMDALKKAEEEKKRAASQNQVSADGSGEPVEQEDSSGEELTPEQVAEKASTTDKLELTLAPLDKSADDIPVKADEPAQKISATDDVLDLTASDKNEADKTLVEDYNFSEDLTVEQTIEQNINEAELEETKDANELDSTAILQDLSLDDTSAAPFDDTFHGVVLDDEESAYEETLPGVPADQLIKDLGGSVYQSTPVAAQTVIAAGKKKAKPNSFKWGIFSVLLLLAISSFGVFYYFSITPVARKVPSPVVARGIESTPVAKPVIPEVERDAVSATLIEQQNIATEQVAASLKDKVSEYLAESETEQTELATEIVESNNAEVSTEADLSAIAETTDNVEIEGDSETTAINDITAKVEDNVDADIVEETEQEVSSESEDIAELNSRKSLPEYLKLDQKAVAITKNENLEKESLLVNQAYNAYQQNNFPLAKSMYEDVLHLQQDNRDAHLGLAVISVRQGDLQQAMLHYQAVLNLDPDDAVALTGIQGLLQNRDPVRDESAIKLLLQKEGEQAYLYFALGNSYAKQKRWPEAQQAFFDAHRLDKTNAQYAMNLAIALDHLSQHSSALDFYRLALSFPSASDKLDVFTVQQRINALDSMGSN